MGLFFIDAHVQCRGLANVAIQRIRNILCRCSRVGVGLGNAASKVTTRARLDSKYMHILIQNAPPPSPPLPTPTEMESCDWSECTHEVACPWQKQLPSTSIW